MIPYNETNKVKKSWKKSQNQLKFSKNSIHGLVFVYMGHIYLIYVFWNLEKRLYYQICIWKFGITFLFIGYKVLVGSLWFIRSNKTFFKFYWMGRYLIAFLFLSSNLTKNLCKMSCLFKNALHSPYKMTIFISIADNNVDIFPMRLYSKIQVILGL